MTDQNEKLIEKAILAIGGSASWKNGGYLNALQQDRFTVLIRKFGGMLPLVRFVRMPRPTMEINKLHLGEPLTVGASENTSSSQDYVPKVNKITLSTTKVSTTWVESTELLQSNVEQDNFEQTLMNSIAERMATDLELLAIRGDSTITGSAPENSLLKVLDGWDVQTNQSQIVDLGGDYITKAVWSLMMKRMPKQYMVNQGVSFLAGRDLAVDWMDSVADRVDGMNVLAQGMQSGGPVAAPYGIPLRVINLIPDNKKINDVDEATPAWIIGSKFGPFNVDASGSYQIKVMVDNLPQVTVSMVSSGTATLETSVVCSKINSALLANASYGAKYGAVAREAGEGRILLISPTTGTASVIQLDDASAQTLMSTLGFDNDAHSSSTTESASPISPQELITGQAVSSGNVPTGTFIWLAPLQNFIFNILDGTRMFTQFNQSKDVIETVIYNQIGCSIEDIQAIVKASNVRIR